MAASGHLGLLKIPKKAKDDLEKVKICYNHLAHVIKTNLEYRVCTKELCFLPRFFADKI